MTGTAADVLRVVTAGSVDDGKSTLIGRLLVEGHGVHQDTLESLAKAGAASGNGLDLAFITDGLKAEREQGITIDVAWRYFRTSRRSFIIGDCPGHEEFTRNMVTGASTAGLAVILMDARKGVLAQTRRHTSVVGLIGLPRVVAVVNKMDLVDYQEEVFNRIRSDFLELARQSGIDSAEAIPASALKGENVTGRTQCMPWYSGPSLLEYLESVPIPVPEAGAPLRFPVQWVAQAPGGFRGYAGTLAAGTIRTGMQVAVLPGVRRAHVKSIHALDGECQTSSAPSAITVCLDHNIECDRGSLIVDAEYMPAVERRLDCDLVWTSEQPLEAGRPYLLKRTTQVVSAKMTRIAWRLDFETLQRVPAGELRLNDIGRVTLEACQPIPLDTYGENRTTGSFILIDPRSNETAGVGMVRRVGPDSREGLVIWFTGLSSSGKTTLSTALNKRLSAMGYRVEHLDGDSFRQHLGKDLGFSREDRDENICRIGYVTEMLARHGVTVLVSAISPYRAARDEVRARVGRFIEIYVNAPLEVCEQRDVKGLYQRARAGLLHGFTGVDDPYEPPLNPELECQTAKETVEESVQSILAFLTKLY